MRFRRANAILPEPLEGWGRTFAENHGRCILCGKYTNRAARRYAAKLLPRDTRLRFPTAPYCRDHALVARAAIELGQPLLVPREWTESDHASA